VSDAKVIDIKSGPASDRRTGAEIRVAIARVQSLLSSQFWGELTPSLNSVHSVLGGGDLLACGPLDTHPATRRRGETMVLSAGERGLARFYEPPIWRVRMPGSGNFRH
jgi:hypothetical protein